MSKISTYEVVPVPKLADKLIGTSVGGEIEDATYNFTLLELLELFLPNIPANNLQGVLDYGNTATQDINLFGTITTTNLDVTDTANLFITYLNEETHIVGGVYDSEDSVGTSGQVLTSTGEGVAWVTLPPIFTPNLQQVLTEGNTSTIGIVLDATLEALNVDTDDAIINTNITIDGTITDGNAEVGAPGQVLSSTATGVEWVDLPAYSAVSPLLFNSVTGVFSIQQASNVQGGYLSASDWITFDGKQNAGNYITALSGEASASGPGAASTILSNAAVIAKVLTGFNPTAGTINASDTILTAFGKTQSQINALVGGVQYKGTWNASTNVPTLQSSVGVQGNYYIVSVAGNTNLNGITDWQVGDWAIFSETTWQKVDNTESVTSVNGFTGAVSLTTDNIPEGATNLYYLDSRARGALSFAAGSGAYNNVTGVITIPTNNNQILNGAGYITLASLSASAPLSYNNLTGGFAIQKSDATHDGYLSSTDWSTFNNKQNYLGGTGLVKSTAGTISYITDNSGNWNTAYDRSIVSAAVTGTSTKTLTLTEQDGNTIQASWTDLDTGLTSVGVSMPSAFSVANSPLTANGTIAVTGAGTTLQYIDGTGALQTFPGLTGFVPYTGATQNVNLGTYGLLADYLQLNTAPTSIPTTEGTMSWNSTDGTMDLILKGGNVTLQVGEENVTRVVNKSGIDLLQENYQVVRARKVAEGGAQGQRIAVVLAQGNSENSSTEVLGLVTETINVNQEGFITCFGEVKEINTTGSLQGETWVDGDILYLSNTTAGALTNVRPVAPNHSVIVGYVTYAHAVHGKIYMAIDTGYELGELHNVYAPSPTANQSIYWNVANSRYQLNTIGGILGYTPANAATLISTTAPLSGGGDLSANRTLSISQAGTSTDGYLSSTDWNTFNNKQPAGSYVPTSRLLSINGTQYDLSADRSWNVGTVTSVAALTLGTSGTDLSSSVATGTTTPVITLNVPTASAANRGALSAADWSTFNTKVGSVTASSPLSSSGGSTPNITIQQASGSQDGYLSSTDWTTFNNKQAAGNYITSLTGEATASGPGAAAVTLNNASVTAKVLTGINITGGTVQATDTMLTAFGKLQNQINGLVGGSIYQGTWNASTNTPALASGVGTKGYYYIVSVAGNTNLDGITDWFVGDWAIFDGTAWQQVDNTDAVVSVNGQTGAVSLTTDNIPEGATNQYFLNSRARAALSFAAGSGAYNSTSGLITIPTNTNQLTNGASFITLASLSGTAPIVYSNTTGAISITQAGTSSNGYLSSTDWNTFNNKQPAGNYVPYTGANANVDLGAYFLKTSKVYNTFDWLKEVAFGYAGWTTLMVGINSASTLSLAFNVDLSGNTSPSFTGNGNEYFWRNTGTFKTPNAANNGYNTFITWNSVGNISFNTIIAGIWNGTAITDTYIASAATWNAKQNAITLTTTGTSGAATLVGSTLNIPQYQSVLTNPVTGTGVTNRITYWDSASSISYLDTASYPSLTELSYVKGVTSSIQTQLDGKQPTGSYVTLNTAQTITATKTMSVNQTGAAFISNNANTSDQAGVAQTTWYSEKLRFGVSVVSASNGIIASNGADTGLAFMTHNTTSGWVERFVLGSDGNATFTQIVTANSLRSAYITIVDNQINSGRPTNGYADLWINYLGYNNGSTQYRDFRVGDGRGSQIVKFKGETKDVIFGVSSNVYFNYSGTDTDQSYAALIKWNGLQLGNNGNNDIVAGQSGAGGYFNIWVNNTNRIGTPNGTKSATFNANGSTSFLGNVAFNSNVESEWPILSEAGASTVAMRIRLKSNTRYRGDFAISSGGLSINSYDDTGSVYRPMQFDASAITLNTNTTVTAYLYATGGLAMKNDGYRELLFLAANGASRWDLYSYGVGETGSNVSGNLYLARYNDDGSYLGQVFSIIRATGVTTFTNALYASNISGTNTGDQNLQQVTDKGSTTTTRTTFVEVGVTKDGSDTVAAGPWFRWTNAAESRQMLTQLNASNGLTWWGYNGTSWIKRMTLSQETDTRLTLSAVSNNPRLVFEQPGVINRGTTSDEMYIGEDADTGGFNIRGSGTVNIGGQIDMGLNRKIRVQNPSMFIDGLTPSYFGYSSGYGILLVGHPGNNNRSIAFGVDVTGNPSGAFSGLGSEYVWRNAASFITPNAANNGYNTILSWNSSGYLSANALFVNGIRIIDNQIQSGYGSDSEDADVWINYTGYNAGATRFRDFRVGNGKQTQIFWVDGSTGTTAFSYRVTVANNAAGAATISTNNANSTDDAGVSNLNFDGNRLRLGVLPSDGAYGCIASSGAASTGLAFVTHNGSNWGEGMRLTPARNLIVIGSVTATSFFESSDSRLKSLIKDDYKALGIESVKAKLYFKDGKRELGYYAQDLENILPSAVSINDAGFLSLSYTQVHTAKISIIEDEVDVLKRRVTELESKLQKYEA